MRSDFSHRMNGSLADNFARTTAVSLDSLAALCLLVTKRATKRKWEINSFLRGTSRTARCGDQMKWWEWLQNSNDDTNGDVNEKRVNLFFVSLWHWKCRSQLVERVTNIPLVVHFPAHFSDSVVSCRRFLEALLTMRDEIGCNVCFGLTMLLVLYVLSVFITAYINFSLCLVSVCLLVNSLFCA